MRSCLLLTALMVLASPVKADDTLLLNRAGIVGALAAADCNVRNGEITEKQARKLMKEYVNENPGLNAAYSWAKTSDKAWEAAQALVPHMTADCNGFTISQDEAGRIIKPYLE